MGLVPTSLARSHFDGEITPEPGAEPDILYVNVQPGNRIIPNSIRICLLRSGI
jgi:hypothetical protein